MDKEKNIDGGEEDEKGKRMKTDSMYKIYTDGRKLRVPGGLYLKEEEIERLFWQGREEDKIEEEFRKEQKKIEDRLRDIRKRTAEYKLRNDLFGMKEIGAEGRIIIGKGVRIEEERR